MTLKSAINPKSGVKRVCLTLNSSTTRLKSDLLTKKKKNK